MEGSKVLRMSRRHVFTAGRPPWYTKSGQNSRAFIIGCSGGSASGKTTVADKIIGLLDIPWVVLLSMDSFYKVLTKEQIERAHKNEYDFDHPDAFDFPLLVETLEKLRKGEKVEVPIYDFTTHSRMQETKTIYGASVVVFEGIFALHDPKVVELMDLKIFVDTDDDIRLARRLRRDIAERGRDVRGVLDQYFRFVKPSFDKFIRPCIQKADVIVPRGGDNDVAIELIAEHVKRALKERGFNFRKELACTPDCSIPENVYVMHPTNQIKVIHTIIRDKNTTRDDFIFYSNRLFRLIVEEALSMLEFQDVVVETPVRLKYEGQRSVSEICAVSIVRAGVCLEHALSKVCQDAVIGKILIQTDFITGEPQLHYCNLPKNVSKCKVLLLDATIATGAAALMAIRVLLDHKVQPENIIFAALIAAPQGLRAINNAFPEVKIVVSEVEKGLNDQFYLIPGIGNFGDRFYGTEVEKEND